MVWEALLPSPDSIHRLLGAGRDCGHRSLVFTCPVHTAFWVNGQTPTVPHACTAFQSVAPSRVFRPLTPVHGRTSSPPTDRRSHSGPSVDTPALELVSGAFSPTEGASIGTEMTIRKFIVPIYARR